VTSNGTVPAEDVLALARERGTAVVSSPLDSYVTSRLLSLSAPCRALMDGDPLTLRPEDLVSDIAEQIQGRRLPRAAVAVRGGRWPVGLVTHAELVSPEPRRGVLVDHAEQAQTVPWVEHAEIVEILDHHHVGSIETKVPVTATFDPVASTSTLVIERFRQNGLEPSRPAAVMLLGAVLSNTVISTRPRPPSAIARPSTTCSGCWRWTPRSSGARCGSPPDVSEVDAELIVVRDAKEYPPGDGQTICIAQLETVGDAVLKRSDEFLEASARPRPARGHLLCALMVTDIMAKGTKLLVAGDDAPVERIFGRPAIDGASDLPGSSAARSRARRSSSLRSSSHRGARRGARRSRPREIRALARLHFFARAGKSRSPIRGQTRGATRWRKRMSGP
jgi:manganese-dependent inorganic pyrophosphatase